MDFFMISIILICAFNVVLLISFCEKELNK